MGLQYLSDVPIQTPEQDRFNRSGFARRIADTIRNRTDSSSLAIGVYGAWGDGKTSVLNLIKTTLDHESDIVCVKFNPWRVDGEPALLQNFFGALAAAMRVSLGNRREKIGKTLRDYGKLLERIPTFGSGLGTFAGVLGEKWGEPALETLRERISAQIRAANKKLVIFIDDIDRLEKTEIQGLFRLIKLTADFENTIYVLAFDSDMVAGAIGERFVSDPVSHVKAGQSFLEKIVQVPLHLPPPSTADLENFCFECAEPALRESQIELSQKEVNEFVLGFRSGAAIRLLTPRMATRYANALTFALGALKGEAYPADVMLVEALRVFFPELFEFVRDHRDVVLNRPSETAQDRSEALEKIIHDSMPTLTPTEVTSAKMLLRSLFPRTRDMSYGYDWESTWLREKRVCSPACFSRYFSYGIGQDDVSDQSLNAALEELAQATKDISLFRSLIRSANAQTLIQKLRAQEERFRPEVEEALALALIRCGDLLPRQGGMFGETSAWTQASILITNLVKRQPQVSRARLATELLSKAEPLAFAIEFYQWLTCAEKPEDQIVPIQEHCLLKSCIAQRIRGQVAVAADPLFVIDGPAFTRIIFAWRECDEPTAVSDYVRSELERHSETVMNFLRCFLPNSWDMTTGMPLIPPVMRQSYDMVESLVDPALVCSLLAKKFNLDPRIPSDQSLVEDDPDRQLARQFIRLHKIVTEQKQSDKSNSVQSSEMATNPDDSRDAQ
jgi:KAP family P-loop domain